MQRDYKSFSPMVTDAAEADWGSAPAIQETPVQSAIISPQPTEAGPHPMHGARPPQPQVLAGSDMRVSSPV